MPSGRLFASSHGLYSISHFATSRLIMSTILFESIFAIKTVNKDGTYFDRGTH